MPAAGPLNHVVASLRDARSGLGEAGPRVAGIGLESDLQDRLPRASVGFFRRMLTEIVIDHARLTDTGSTEYSTAIRLACLLTAAVAPPE